VVVDEKSVHGMADKFFVCGDGSAQVTQGFAQVSASQCSQILRWIPEVREFKVNHRRNTSIVEQELTRVTTDEARGVGGWGHVALEPKEAELDEGLGLRFRAAIASLPKGEVGERQAIGVRGHLQPSLNKRFGIQRMNLSENFHVVTLDRLFFLLVVGR
jgi:hypothetical protein